MNALLNRAVENMDLDRENDIIAYGAGVAFAVLVVLFLI